MKNFHQDILKSTLILSAIIGTGTTVRAEDAKKSSSGADAEMIEVEKVKEKYWAQGQESRLGVVQNRLYSKAEKLQLGIGLGRSMNDPFLSVTPIVGELAYNFNETWGLGLIGGHYLVKPSNALKTLRAGGKQANTIEPRYFLVPEVQASVLYGKLSLLGSSIIYYDMHLDAGAGITKTENDNAAITGSVGIGQRFFINKWMALKFDYRLQTYSATEKEKEITAQLGNVNGKIRSYSHMLALSLNFMFPLKSEVIE